MSSAANIGLRIYQRVTVRAISVRKDNNSISAVVSVLFTSDPFI